MLDSVYRFASTLLDLILRIIVLPFYLVAWLFSLLPYWRIILLSSIFIVLAYFHARYSSQIIDNGLYIMNKVAAPYYQEDWRPILGGIIRQFFNRFVCWYNAFLWFPYGYGREVVFPIMREAGFGTVVSNFALFLKQVAQDVLLGYIINGQFFTEEIDFTSICQRWMTFWESWQYLICFGCNDLCPFFTKLPIIPMLFTSDQLRDQAFWNFVTESINGWCVFFQQVIYIIRDVLFPISSRKRVTIRADFKRAFDLWVSAGNNFWKSFENILNVFWVEFIPFAFDWTDLLQIFNIAWTMMLRSIQLLIDIALNSDRVIDHFSATDSTYWVESVKEDYKVIIGLMAVASYFDDIPLLTAKKMPSSVITNYELRPTQPSLPNGLANPLFNQILGSSYACLLLERVFCDPANQGISCAQKFQGTLLEDVDICCPVNTLLGVATDAASFLFEFSLHLKDSDDFVRYADKQPFTTQFKQRTIDFLGCAFMFFRVVRNYGFCIERVLFELTNFIVCTGELLFRVLIAAITLPYYEQFLPGETNFISTGGGNAPVKMATEFLDRIADDSTVDGLINCFSYLINTGFMVSFAGCNSNTCIPTGFIDPSGLNKRYDYQEQRRTRIRGYFGSSFYNLTSKTGYYRDELTPIKTYGKQLGSISFANDWNSYKAAVPALYGAMSKMGKNYHDVYTQWTKGKCNQPIPGEIGVCSHPDLVYERVMGIDQKTWNPFRFENMPVPRKRLVTSAPIEQVNCPTNATIAPCFDLSCLFTKVIQLSAHTVAFSVRALNEFIQARTATGSTYFTGESCLSGDPCLESDATMFVVKAINILGCFCEYVKLLIPNKGGFKDPCCAFTVAGELASCIIQIIINIGNSINGDAPNYTYIQDPAFLVNDFNMVLRIALALFDCACDFVRAIFAVALQSKADLVKSFDPCCFLRTFVRAVLAAAKMLFRVALSMATLDREDSQCYMYVRVNNTANPARANCPFGIPQLGAMRDFAEITVALFAVPDERMQRECGVLRNSEDPDQFGAATCYCRTINSLLTMVFKFIVPPGMDPTMVTEHNTTIDGEVANTCIIDLCCPVYRLSTIAKGLIDFTAQLLWSFIQNWEDRVVQVGIIDESFYLPQEFFEFFFCDEYGPENYYVDQTINVFSLENGGQLDAAVVNEVYVLTDASIFGEEVTNAIGSDAVPLDLAVVPNFNGSTMDTGIPSLTQNRPLTAPDTYGEIVGIINTGGTLSSQEIARAKCGKLEPVIIGIFNLLGRCLCPGCHVTNSKAKGIGNAMDKVLRFTLAWVTGQSPIFPTQLLWPHCLCCGGPESDRVGMAVPFASSLSVAIRQIFILARNIANPSYWQPAGTTLQGGNAASVLADNLEDIKKTWISRFLAPFADATCRFITNSACLLSLLLGDTCAQGSNAPLGNDYDIRYKVVSSVWRYAAEALIRIIALFEGMIKLFTQELPGQCVGSPKNTQGNANIPAEQGSDGATLVPTCSQKVTTNPHPNFPSGTDNPLNPRNIGRIIVSLVTFVFDAIIGVGALSCTQVCPGLMFATDAMNVMTNSTCNCYNLSPYVGISSSVCSYEECDKVFNGQANNEARDPPTFTCQQPGSDGTCTAEEALLGHTGLTTVYVDEPVSYQEYRLTNDRCNSGCSNDTELAKKGVMYTTVGNAAWENTYGEANKFSPAIFNGQLVCASPNIIGTPLETLAGELYGKNYRFFPDVSVPVGSDSRCLCYFPGATPIDTITVGSVTRTYGLTPTGVLGCGTSYPTISVDGIDYGSGAPEGLLQSVCPSFQLVDVGFMVFLPVTRYPLIYNMFLGFTLTTVNELATYNRCQDCLTATGGAVPQCTTWDIPPSPNSDLISSGLGECMGPGQVFGSTFCNQFPGGVCSNPTRNILFSLLYVPATDSGGCCNQFDGPTCIDLNVTRCDLICTQCLATGFQIPQNGVLAPASTQPPCERPFCISKGWCKNDQLVPCARGFNQPVLDGIAIVALKYVRCLLRNLFNNLGVPGLGNVVGGIITFVLHLLSIIWQLSGGIIRFGVAVFVLSLQLAQGIATGTIFNIIGLGKTIADVCNAFVNIFRQPVVLSAGPGRSVQEEQGCIAFRDNPAAQLECYCREQNIPEKNCISLMHGLGLDPRHRDSRFANDAPLRNFQQAVSNFLDYPEAHRCIQTSTPEKCFCKTVDLSFFCKYNAANDTLTPENIKLTDLITQLSYIFNDNTNCQEIWKHLNVDFEQTSFTAWNDIPYARRVEAVECLTHRARGESWSGTIDTFPRSYFYDTRGNSRWLGNIVDKAINTVKRIGRNQDARIRQVLRNLNTTHSFEKRFGMTHSEYLNHLNRRAHRFRDHLKSAYGMNEHSIMLEPLLHMDSYYYRWSSGYWGHLVGRAYNLYDSGEASLMITGSVSDMLAEMQDSVGEIAMAYNASWTHWSAMQGEVRNMYHGLMNPTTGSGDNAAEYEYPEMPFTWNSTKLKEMFPIFGKPSFNWGPRLEVEIPKLLPDIRWTERINHNWDAVHRIIRNAIHTVWPHYTTQEHHERFIIAGNCRLMDGLIELGTEVADYCIAEFIENTPTNRDDPLFGRYWKETQGFRNRKWNNETYEWKPGRAGGDWKRPVLRNQQYSYKSYRQRIDSRVYKRSRVGTTDSSGRFHLYEFAIDLVERIFGIDLRQTQDNFFAEFADWVQTTNTKPSDYPNVGALYYLSFHLRCEWPENLNCGIGIGLKEALKKVSIYYVIIIVAISLSFPSILTIFGIFFSLPAFVLAVVTVAWHYSFGCTIMFPSTAIWPFAVTVPIFPFPVNILPALPECLWDELIDLADAIFATSYSFIPQTLFNGADGTGIVNCYDIGISDGVQNVLFLGYYYFGNVFVDILIFLSSTTFARIIPGFDTYIVGSLNSYRLASPTEQERQLFCAWFTLPSIIFPALILWLIASFLLIFVPALLAIFSAFIAFIPTLPWYDSITQPNVASGFNAIEGEDNYPVLDEDDDEEDESTPVPPKPLAVNSGLAGWAARKIHHWTMGKQKKE